MNHFEEPPIRNLDSLSASVSFHGALSRSLRDKCTSEHSCAAQHITLALFALVGGIQACAPSYGAY